MKITTVDEFVTTRVLPEFRDIVQMLRQLMSEAAPNAKEMISYGILAWKQNRILAVVSPIKKDITFAFTRGAEFEDKYGLLHGVGSVSKHVKIKNLKEQSSPQVLHKAGLGIGCKMIMENTVKDWTYLPFIAIASTRFVVAILDFVFIQNLLLSFFAFVSGE
jgi:hypothetical protein